MPLKTLGRTSVGLAFAVLSLCATSNVGRAQAAGPFDKLAGNWSGAGSISMTDGHNERIRCKAVYEVTPSGIILHQNLRCASDSYKFEVKSSLQAEDGAISGTWTETTRQVTGDVTGRVSGEQINTSVKGTGFSAVLDVVTRGNGQTVSIKPQGTDIRSVQIDMKRG